VCLDRLDTWIAGSNPAKGMDVFPRVFAVLSRQRRCDGFNIRPRNPEKYLN
jgi:hypothetical protein